MTYINKFKNKQGESTMEIVDDKDYTITNPVAIANTFNT